MEKNEMEYISKDDITALIESYKDRIALNIPEILRDINELETKTIGGQNNDLISRKALKEQSKEVFCKRKCPMPDNDPYCNPNCAARLFIDTIDKAPTVEPFEPDYVGAERLKARQRGYKDGYRNGMEIGKKLNPQIKRGEWEEIEGCFRERRCSNCKRQTPCEEQGKFCINCGADMRKEADNEKKRMP